MLVAKNILPETARILQCRYLRSRLGNALSEPRAWDKSWGAQKYSPKARQRWARCWSPKISCQKQQESYNVGQSTALFFQMDWRLCLIMELQLASHTPLIQ